MSKEEERYWTERYLNHHTGWDIGYPSTPLKAYIDQLTDKSIKILVPGAGNAYEAEYLHDLGFQNVKVLDISLTPLESLKKRVPDFPSDQLIHGDFFMHQGEYDLIFEQTFFCSFEPTQFNRKAYADKICELLVPSGKLVGLWFKHPLDLKGNRPFGGSMEEYKSYFRECFDIVVLEDAYNSIQPRMGNELFGIFKKR